MRIDLITIQGRTDDHIGQRDMRHKSLVDDLRMYGIKSVSRDWKVRSTRPPGQDNLVGCRQLCRRNNSGTVTAKIRSIDNLSLRQIEQRKEPVVLPLKVRLQRIGCDWDAAMFTYSIDPYAPRGIQNDPLGP